MGAGGGRPVGAAGRRVASYGVKRSPARQRAVGLGLGLVILGLLVVFAVVLPKTQDGGALPKLADTLPGGWTAIDVLDEHAPPEGAAQFAEQQREQLAYLEEIYAEVYDEAPEFRAYVDSSLQSYAVVTLFPTSGGSFAPPEGIVDGKALGMERDPVELVRRGDALCTANYQAVAAGQGTAENDQPVSVTCQQSGPTRTLQLATQGVDLDGTFALLEELAQQTL